MAGIQIDNVPPQVRRIVGTRNAPNGFVGIESDGSVLGTFTSRRNTLANIASVVLAPGELAFTTDTKDVFVGDGVTAGGLFLDSAAKYISQAITVTINQSITLTSISAANMFFVQGLSTGLYQYDLDVRALSNQVSPVPNPSNWGFLIMSSTHVAYGSPPYSPGVFPDIYAFYRSHWNDGSVRASEFPYADFPIQFNNPSATSQIAGGMYGKLTGLLYHTNGPLGTLAQAPANSIAIVPFSLSGITTDLMLNVYGSFRRIG